MRFNFTYSSSVSAAPAAFQSAIEEAGRRLASRFSNDIDININIGYGELGGVPVDPATTASTQFAIESHDFSDIRNALISVGSSLADTRAAQTLSASNPFPGANFWLTSAQSKALGLQGVVVPAFDGSVGFSTGQHFDFDASNGIDPGALDFEGVVTRELSRIMGRVLLDGLPIAGMSSYSALDLFHYSAPGQLGASGGPGAINYFSIDGGITNLATFNQVSGGNPTDWDSTFLSSRGDAFHANPAQGVLLPMSPLDIDLIDVIGFTLSGTQFPTSDFNGDGSSDVLLSNRLSELTTWFMESGRIAQNLPSGYSSWTYVSSSNDFNGDGRSDILYRDLSNSSVTFFLKDGTSTIAQSSLGPLSEDYRFQGAADFNGDGKDDILWRHKDGAVAMWTIGAQDILGFSFPAIAENVNLPAVDNNWRIQGLGDFNGDEMSDVLWRHISGQIVFWQMDGSDIRDNQALRSQVDLNWHVAGIGDFNGDGNSDVVWRHNSGFVSLWTMDGYNIQTNTAIADVDNQWRIEQIGDFNSDGKSDLLWRHASGFVSIWEMDGSMISDNYAVGDLSKEYQILSYKTPTIDLV